MIRVRLSRSALPFIALLMVVMAGLDARQSAHADEAEARGLRA